MKYSNNVNLFDQSNHWGVDQIQARINCNNCGHGADVLPGTCTGKTSKLPKIHLVWAKQSWLCTFRLSDVFPRIWGYVFPFKQTSKKHWRSHPRSCANFTKELLRWWYSQILENEEVAIKLVKNIIGMCQKGGFKLTKLMSNSRGVLTTIPEERRHKKIKDLDLNIGNQPAERALGIHWNIKNGYLGFKKNLKDKPVTRKGILCTVSSVCDPFKIATVVVLGGWKSLQKLCKLKVGWHEKIPNNVKKGWVCSRNKLQK